MLHVCYVMLCYVMLCYVILRYVTLRNVMLCYVIYTGWPKITEQSSFQDFALINSYLFSPCWIEHLFLIIITPRSSNVVTNFSFYE